MGMLMRPVAGVIDRELLKASSNESRRHHAVILYFTLVAQRAFVEFTFVVGKWGCIIRVFSGMGIVVLVSVSKIS
jgi:hypothetical protein